MNCTAFVAGATGAIGRPLVSRLLAAGWRVQGSTRHPDRAAALRQAGVTAVVLDMFDRPAVHAALARLRPDVVVHQLTDLPATPATPEAMAAALPRNARLRVQGTRNLVDAMQAAGCRRLVLQSIAWAYAPGPLPHREVDALDLAATGDRAVTVQAVSAMETMVLQAPGLVAAVLRLGRLHGPGTWTDTAPEQMPLHVHDAAQAAVLAARWLCTPGAESTVFNLGSPGPWLCTRRAQALLGWAPEAALWPPAHPAPARAPSVGP